MTTKFLDNKICNFEILLSWRFPPPPPKKNSVFGRFSSLPSRPPPPPQKRKIYFYCRLAVSENMVGFSLYFHTLGWGVSRFRKISRDSREWTFLKGSLVISHVGILFIHLHVSLSLFLLLCVRQLPSFPLCTSVFLAPSSSLNLSLPPFLCLPPAPSVMKEEEEKIRRRNRRRKKKNQKKQ